MSEEIKSQENLPTKYKRILTVKKIMSKVSKDAHYFKKEILKKIGEKINQKTEEYS